MFGSALLRHEGVRGFGFGIGCSGVIQMTQDGCRQVGVGRIGVGTVTVVTVQVCRLLYSIYSSPARSRLDSFSQWQFDYATLCTAMEDAVASKS